MIWIAVAILALAAFALAALAMGVRRRLYSSLLAALALGLAGYALQASPNLPAAPKAGNAQAAAPLFDPAEMRREMLAPADWSRADMVLVADAMARQGRQANAVTLLTGATRANPEDFEAWLAQGNALVEHAQGVLTPPALYAYHRAAQLRPQSPAPGYFIGLALIRQGRLMEARQIWRETLEGAPEGAIGRAALAERLLRLEAMLGVPAPEQATGPAIAAPAAPGPAAPGGAVSP